MTRRAEVLVLVVVIAMSGGSNASKAQSIDSMKMAENLGALIAAEEFCGLSYDQAAIADYIEKHVRPDDMSFNNMLTMMTSGTRVQQQEMSPSAKTAYCAQNRRVAQSFHFIK